MGSIKRRWPIALTIILLGFGVFWLFGLHPSTDEPIAPPIKAADQSVMGTNGVPEKLSLQEGQNSTTVTSEPFEAQFTFNAIAPHWTEIPGDEGYDEHRTMKLRVSSDNKTWSDWIEVETEGPLRDNDPHPDKQFTEAPIFTDGRYYQFSFELGRPAPGARAAEISDIVITYLDSRTPERPQQAAKLRNWLLPKAAAADTAPNVVTRAGWGSPDPYGQALKNTQHEWTPTHAPVKQFFVHHTVNANSSSDFSAVVRGIWQFHTYTRGWGDIGYNYLVDGNGRIYEGRYGGDNVVGGHVLGYNRGSMGIGLIGCFNAGDPECTSVNGGNSGPSANMLNSLYNLIGWKSKSYEIDPEGSHSFCGNTDAGNVCLNLPTVTGHRDANQTSCPGNMVYDLLPTIRAGAQSRKANLFPYAARQLSFSSHSLSPGQNAITLQFKNTGTATWSRTSPRLWLKTAAPDDRTSSLQGSGWTTSQHAALLNEASVPPGGTGTFTFNVTADTVPENLYQEGFRLVAEGASEFTSYYLIPILSPTYRWSYISANYSSGSARMAPGSTQTITITAKNIGTATWVNSGLNPMRLGTWPPGRQSAFAHSSWLNPSRIATMQEGSVVPGANGTFVFTVQAPAFEGEFGERFNLVAENRTWARDIDAQLYFHVVNPYRWQPVSLSHSLGTALMDPGDTQTITVVAKNTGSATWTKNGTYPIRMGTWPPSRGSGVYHTSWLNQIRPAELQEASVIPGANGTFVFTVQPLVTRQYFERINLVAEGLTWFNDPGLEFYLDTRKALAWEPVSINHSTGTALNKAGTTLTLTLKARNTGNLTWKNSGNFPVRLATTRPQDRGSILYHSSWLNGVRPANLQETSVPPGSIGTFTFTAQVPHTPGEYHEYFSLIAENIGWLNDPGVSFYIKSIP